MQGFLAKMNQSSIELAQLACSFTNGYQAKEYKVWRSNVVFDTLTLLKSTVAMVYKGGKENVWELPEFDDNPILLHLEQAKGSSKVDNSREEGSIHNHSRPSNEIYRITPPFKSDKNLRVPIRVAHRLRDSIMAHRYLPTDPIDTMQEKILLDLVKGFMESYHGVRKYLTCPLPLPLVQLGRIFVIFYVYSESLNEKDCLPPSWCYLTCSTMCL